MSEISVCAGAPARLVPDDSRQVLSSRVSTALAAPLSTGGDIHFVADGIIRRSPELEALAERASRLPGVERVVLLPDAAPNGPEKAVSWAVQSSGFIIPAFTSNVVNCGISLLDTSVNASEVPPEWPSELLKAIWRASGQGDYVLSAGQVDRCFLEGAPALVSSGWLQPEDAGSFEFGGVDPGTPLTTRHDLDELVPLTVRRMKKATTPVRADLRGNHFLEAQEVGFVQDPRALLAMGLRQGRLVLMLHTDHQVTDMVNQHYVLRETFFDKPFWKRMAYTASKVRFHFGAPWSWSTFPERWSRYFRGRQFTVIPTETREGERYLAAYAACSNYAYAARAAVYRMTMDVIRSMAGAAARPRLVWDAGHDSIRPAQPGGPHEFTVRKGAVESLPGKPCLIAGYYDIPSLLGVCQGSASTAYSYDHGSANFRRNLGREDSLANGQSPVRRFKAASREPSSVRFKEELHPVRDASSMNVLADILRREQTVRPVAWLRPVANLSEG